MSTHVHTSSTEDSLWNCFKDGDSLLYSGNTEGGEEMEGQDGLKGWEGVCRTRARGRLRNGMKGGSTGNGREWGQWMKRNRQSQNSYVFLHTLTSEEARMVGVLTNDNLYLSTANAS